MSHFSSPTASPKHSAHTDILKNDWIDQWWPHALKPYARLARLDRPIGTWLLLLPAFWSLALGHGTLYQAFLFTVGAVLMRSAGCTINDMWDRKIDAQVERTQSRPLASGALSLREAFIFLCFLLLAGLLVLIQFSLPTILLGIASLVLVVSYPLMKRITWWPQAFLGFTFNWGVLMGAQAATGTLPLWVWPLYSAGVLWTLAYDTIYAHQDKVDDQKVAIKSTALYFGKRSKIIVGLFFFLALLLWISAGMIVDLSRLFLLAMIPPFFHIIWQLRTWDMDQPQSCLRIFKSNRNLGILILFAYMMLF